MFTRKILPGFPFFSSSACASYAQTEERHPNSTDVYFLLLLTYVTITLDGIGLFFKPGCCWSTRYHLGSRPVKPQSDRLTSTSAVVTQTSTKH